MGVLEVSEQIDVELDARGQKCPMPVVNARKAIEGMASGQVLKVVATDPGSVSDFQAWSRRTGHPLLGMDQGGGLYTYIIQKK